jgi:hypothetical protein
MKSASMWDKVEIAWVDAFGRVSKPSNAVTVSE